MKAIWKFPLNALGEQWVAMPSNARMLDVQSQNGCLCLWALVDPDAPMKPHRIRIFGTGHPVEDDPGAYIATVQETVSETALVWHVFVTPPSEVA